MLNRTLDTTPAERVAARGPILRRLLSYLTPYWRTLLVVLGLLVMTAIAQAGAPALIGQAVDRFIVVGDRPGLARTMWLLLLVYLIGLVAFIGQAALMGTVAQKLLLRLRHDLFERLQQLSLRYYDTHEAGDLMSRLTNDTEVIGNLLSQALIQALGATFGLVGILLAMLWLNVPLALAAMAILPVMLLTTQGFARRARGAFRTSRATIGALSATMQEDIATVREAQAFNRTAQNIERFERSNAANRDATVRAGGVTSAFGPAIDVLSTLATALVAGVGGWLAFRGQATVGTVVAFLAYVDRFYRPVQQISTLYTQMQAALAASERLFELLDEQPDLTDAPDALPLPPLHGAVRFEQVSFAYGPERPVLHDISLDVQPGQTIALVGPTGAGKTTLASLVGRFYDVSAGRITVDGHDVRAVTRASLRAQLGIVPQEPFLFAGTIAENLRYGRADATMEEIVAATTAANAHEFISALPEGYESVVGERGQRLSRGQSQLLAIARALLADPRMLILDEATASVDTRTERLIQEALATLLRGRTAFIIAHRLSTIRDADCIVVLDAGRIIEQGTHEALIARGGLYATLYRQQAA